MSRRVLLIAALFGLKALAGCDGQLGDLCTKDDDCAGELRCALEPGATRGACAYPAGLTDLGVDATIDNGGPDQRVDVGDAGTDVDLGLDGSPDLSRDLSRDLAGDLPSDVGVDQNPGGPTDAGLGAEQTADQTAD